MIVPSFQVLDFCSPDAIFDVLDAKRAIVFGSIDFERLTELAEAGQICAYVRGARLRWIELIVPLSEVKSTERARQSAHSASDAIAQDNRTVRRGHDITALHYDHDMRVSRAYGLPRFTAAFPRVHAHHNDPDGPRLRPAAAALRPAAAAARVSLAGKLAQAQP